MMIVGVIKGSTMKWAGHVGRMRNIRVCKKTMKGRNHVGDLLYRVNRYLKELKCERVDLIQLAQGRIQRQSLVIMVLSRDGV
jgi:hypothetical protein